MRLFVALDIPEGVRAAISKLVAKLRNVCPSARWIRVEGAHVTLKFIGEVSAEKTETIRTALSTLFFSSPIKMSFRGLGFFPNERRPSVLWAGVESNAELGALAATVETTLEPLGIVREQRTFSPHLTLARFGSSTEMESLRTTIAKAGPLEFGDTIAREFHLYQSVLKRGGAEYTRVSSFRCAEGESK